MATPPLDVNFDIHFIRAFSTSVSALCCEYERLLEDNEIFRDALRRAYDTFGCEGSSVWEEVKLALDKAAGKRNIPKQEEHVPLPAPNFSLDLTKESDAEKRKAEIKRRLDYVEAKHKRRDNQ